MLLSSLPTDDAALFGAVHDGYVLDDGGPVESEVLAYALELWRMTGSLAGVRAGLTAWRPGEPWELWVDAALGEWAELRPRVERLRVLAVAVALTGEASRVALEERRALERQVERADAARAIEVGVVELLKEVLRG